MGLKLRIERTIFGEINKHDFEDRLTILTVFTIFLISVLASIINIILNLETLTVITIIGAVIGLFLFILTRTIQNIYWLKLVVNVFALIYLDIVWYFNYGSYGPVLYLYIMFYTSIIYACSGFIRKILLFLYILNTLLFFFIEFVHPDLLGNYLDSRTRIFDIYFGILIYLACTGYLFVLLKNSLIKESKRAKESDQLKSAFLSNVSHEIRTPMNAIMGFSGLLRLKKDSPEKINTYTNLIYENSSYLMNLIDDILNISLIESDQIQIVYKKFNIAELFKEINVLMNEFRVRMRSNVKVDFEVKDQQAEMFSDRTRIKEILINLITNSIKFTNKGSIIFSFEKLEDEVLFKVKDTGVGIKDIDREKIFESFNKIDPSSDKDYRGTGLGLTLSKKIVEKLNGTIWFDSYPNSGSVFWFTIPLDKE